MSPAGEERPDDRAWRRATRQALVTARTAVGDDARASVQRHLGGLLDELLLAAERAGARSAVAFYWPIKGEVALFGPLRRAITRGAAAALPFITAPGVALDFRRWAPGTRVVRGIWNIPTPAVDDRIAPTIVLAPVVGFDDHGHRLGNGGGFYDRTFAALPATTVRVGIGFECLRLPTIRPEAHDLPMDWIVTELGAVRIARIA